jgi:GAF domain-containing protein
MFQTAADRSSRAPRPRTSTCSRWDRSAVSCGSRRAGAEEFTVAERELLADAARQIGLAARAEALADDLQAARERLIRAREQERLRI